MTRNLPAVTHTVYKSKGMPSAITKTITTTSFGGEHGQLSTHLTTTTSMATITTPRTTPTTQTTSVVDTVTQTATVSATATADPCSRVYEGIPRALSGDGIVLSHTEEATGPNAASACCRACYGGPVNCVFYSVGAGLCQVYSAALDHTGSRCFSALCPRGFIDGLIGNADGMVYRSGPYAGVFVK